MKLAKSEAEKIINAYKADLESNYQGNVNKMNGKNGAAGNELQANTASDIANLE